MRTTEFPDSDSYLIKAGQTLLDREYFIGSGRFFVVPLVYKVVTSVAGYSLLALTIAQLVLSAAAWIAFAATCARIAARPVRLAIFAIPLALSIRADVTMWDRVILSESISMACMALLLVLWLRFMERITVVRAAAAVLGGVVWSFAREANSLLLLPFAAALVLWMACFVRERARRGLCLAVAAASVAVVMTSTYVSNRGDRWVFPLLNVVGRHVLTSPERTTFWVNRGMPMTSRLQALAGEFASGQDWAFYTAPELKEFRAWISLHGKSTYTSDLLQHPLRTAREPMHDAEYFVCPDLLVYQPAGMRALLSHAGQTFCGVRRSLAVIGVSAAAGGLLLVAVVWWRHALAPLPAAALLISAAWLLAWVPFVWFVWLAIGDMEISRHVLMGTLAFRIAAIIALAAGSRWPVARRLS